MPNRYLRATYIESERVNAVSLEAEVLWTRLLVIVDDFGRCEASTKLLRPKLFPLRLSAVREADLVRWLAECEKANLIRLYNAADGKQYLQMEKWEQGRAEKSKCPDPPTVANKCLQPQTTVNGCAPPHPTPNPTPTAIPIPTTIPTPTPISESDLPNAEEIYAAYPRKIAKADALKAIAKALKAGNSELLLAKTQAFAEATTRWNDHDRRYIPHPATWFNRGSYDDDPQTWERVYGNPSQMPRSDHSKGF